MFRRYLTAIFVALLLVAAVGCRHAKVKNPIANVDSKQPDKVLFDRAMDAMNKGRYDVSRLTLQTLINTYPDSEFIARAKLAIGDSWYAEGGTSSLAQAEIEYKDFQTFFPNMPEAAEAQLKVAYIHYRQMEKPDRDYTHAKRAEDEYKQLILQYPDHALVKEAKQRLREVQEVLAEREFRVGRFYYMREAWPAAIARLKSVADTYPLYSGADEALFILGQAYEGDAEIFRRSQLIEPVRGKMIKELTDAAAEAYSRIITRYPATERAADAKARLESLNRPVPAVTPEALALNKQELASRGEGAGTVGRIMGNLKKGPDLSRTTQTGEPTLDVPAQMAASDLTRHTTKVLEDAVKQGTGQVSVEQLGTGTPPPNQPAPRGDQPPQGTPEQTPQPNPATPSTPQEQSTPAGTNANPAAAPTGIPELQPIAPAEQPTATPANPNVQPAPVPPPQQVNQVQAQTGQTTTPNPPDNKNSSSSKKKKKKDANAPK